MSEKITIAEIRNTFQLYPHEYLEKYILTLNLQSNYDENEVLQIWQCLYAETFTWCIKKAYNLPLTYDKNGLLVLNAYIEFLIAFYYSLGIPKVFYPWGKNLIPSSQKNAPENFTIETFFKVCNTIFKKTTDSYFDSIKNNTQERLISEYTNELFHKVFFELREYIVAYVGELTINKFGGQWGTFDDTLVVIGNNGTIHDIGDSVDYRLFKSNISFFSLIMD